MIRRIVVQSKSFKKAFKKYHSHKDFKIQILEKIIDNLAQNILLESKYRDHALVGNLVGYRECHVAADILLIYEKVGEDTLILVNLGSHSTVFK